MLVEKGRLLRVAPDAVRATLFLERAADTLADLPHLKLPQNRYNLAHDAAHAVGEAMLARHGYRRIGPRWLPPLDGGHVLAPCAAPSSVVATATALSASAAPTVRAS